MQDYDIVVMATDGVFDNLYDHHIVNCIKPLMSDKYSTKKEKVDLGLLKDPQMAADCIAKEAEKHGTLDRYLSPFAREARRIFGDFEARGKPDDVTVVVAQVHSANQGRVRLPRKNGQLDKAIQIQNVPYKEQEHQGTGYTMPYYDRVQEAKYRSQKNNEIDFGQGDEESEDYNDPFKNIYTYHNEDDDEDDDMGGGFTQ